MRDMFYEPTCTIEDMTVSSTFAFYKRVSILSKTYPYLNVLSSFCRNEKRKWLYQSSCNSHFIGSTLRDCMRIVLTNSPIFVQYIQYSCLSDSWNAKIIKQRMLVVNLPMHSATPCLNIGYVKASHLVEHTPYTLYICGSKCTFFVVPATNQIATFFVVRLSVHLPRVGFTCATCISCTTGYIEETNFRLMYT